MTAWKARRFWKTATAAPKGVGFTVLLDEKPVRTPAKAEFVVPTRVLAEAIALEWDAQTGTVKPETMPLTRTANSAIDKVAHQHAAVAAHLAEYGGSDLLCYRAEGPSELVARQAEAWNKLLDWAAEVYGAPLLAVKGVIHHPQPVQSLQALGRVVAALDPFTLTGFHDLVGLSGSLIIALAVLEGRLDPETAWNLSRIDEQWQQQQWGRDDLAEEAAVLKQAAFLAAARFVELARAIDTPGHS